MKNKLGRFSNLIFCLVVALAVVVADQVSKIIVVNTIPKGALIEVVRNVLNFTYIENTGAAFGMLSNHRWVFMVISVIAIIAIGFYIWKEQPKSLFVKMPLAFVLGGGIGNMIDRTFRGSVVDFIDADFFVYPQVSFADGFSIKLSDFPIFNVADCFITVGCVVLVVYLLAVELPKEAKVSKKANAENNLTTAEKESESESNEQ